MTATATRATVNIAHHHGKIVQRAEIALRELSLAPTGTGLAVGLLMMPSRGSSLLGVPGVVALQRVIMPDMALLQLGDGIAKVEVAGSIPVIRSTKPLLGAHKAPAGVSSFSDRSPIEGLLRQNVPGRKHVNVRPDWLQSTTFARS